MSLFAWEHFSTDAIRYPSTPTRKQLCEDLSLIYAPSGDPAAIGGLAATLHEAAAELAGLGAEPVAIASAPYRFDDCSGAYGWRAIRIGAFHFDSGRYFADPAAALRAGGPPARQAAEILDRLEKIGWRDMYQALVPFQPSPPREMAIVCQSGESFFVKADSVEDSGGAYRIAASDRLEFVGICGRIDWEIGKPVPLRYLSVEAWADRALRSCCGYVEWPPR